MRYIAVGILFYPLLAHAQVGFDKVDLRVLASSEAHRFHSHAKENRDAPTRGYDLKYHRLELAVDPAIRAISGTVTHYFEATTDIQELTFDLSSALVVTSIDYHSGTLGGSSTNDVLTIALPAVIPIGQLDSIAITYSGVPPETGFGSFVQEEHAGAPILWTLSEPYGSRDWWPCKQDLDDKADSLDMIVITPAGQRVASNGLLVSEITLPNGSVRFHWRHRYPIAHYLVAFATTNYAVYSDFAPLPNRTVEILNYVFPESLVEAQSSTSQVIDQMQLFSTLFGEYPFAEEKYGHAQFGWGGGMEHQTMTFLGSFSYELMAHELGHQWFGDQVTCGSWEDIWLNEGFATYLSGLCYEHLAPQYWLPFIRGRRDNVIGEPGGSVRCTDTTNVGRLFDGRITYAKGGLLVHMLRWVCGDSAFYAGCNNYLNDPSIAYASARTPQLQTHLEASSGRDLNEFFSDWYVGEGYPTYTVQWAQNAGGTVDLLLSQSTSHPSVDFYEMPVPIRFKNSAQDTTVVLDHTFSGQSFTFALPFQADSALFDPEIWIISGQSIVTHVPTMAFGNDRLVLYPNPTTADVNIFLGTTVQGPVSVSITDPLGRVVRTLATHARQGTISLSVVGLGAGTYRMEVRTPDGTTVVLPFVKT